MSKIMKKYGQLNFLFLTVTYAYVRLSVEWPCALKRCDIYQKVPSSNSTRFSRGFSQLTFPCSKSTIKTLEKGVKYVHS